MGLTTSSHKKVLFRNLTTSLGETGCQGGQGSLRAVAPSEEEEEEEDTSIKFHFISSVAKCVGMSILGS
jgi:hypothetical protein